LPTIAVALLGGSDNDRTDGETRSDLAAKEVRRAFRCSGLSLDDALDLGQAFEQNAIVWSDETFVPRVILLR
jgi:hypothetical protein